MLSAALLAVQLGSATSHLNSAFQNRIEREARRELVKLPFYGLFDHFSFRVEGETVTLMGKVRRPTLKSDVENAIKKIEGVEEVAIQIEVLPLSSNEERLRLTLYRAIYGHSVLRTLATRAVPPIHIIVENGNVTLEGLVGNNWRRPLPAPRPTECTESSRSPATSW